MLLLGLDIGSSFIKASIIDADSGKCPVTVSYPPQELTIHSSHKGWAEQDPELWYANVEKVIHLLKQKFSGNLKNVGAIGISYQMHGLVLLDKQGKVIRNAIIWCDSRAVDIGDKAFKDLGESYCLNNLLNSPGNFTASKLRWVKEYEPDIYKNIYKIMLPGDYIAFRLTGEMNTTVSALSEGIFWDYNGNQVSKKLMSYFDFDPSLIPEIVPTFSNHGNLKKNMANNLGLKPGIPVTYKAGDQPNNAFSLNALKPGEIAATAGTSGVIYGVSNKLHVDKLSRINTFIHVNHLHSAPRLGNLLCVNGTGILNSWLKNHVVPKALDYQQMNELASIVPSGSDGLMVFPFGNGAERILQNKNINASIIGLDFNIHSKEHLLRAGQEGIVFALIYGLEIMRNMGLDIKVIKAAMANMFLSQLFSQTFSNISEAKIELYKTNGAQGAAKGAGVGIGYYKDTDEALSSLQIIDKVVPKKDEQLGIAYNNWKIHLNKMINHL